jgi:hypothetical protein
MIQSSRPCPDNFCKKLFSLPTQDISQQQLTVHLDVVRQQQFEFSLLVKKNFVTPHPGLPDYLSTQYTKKGKKIPNCH